MSFLRIKKQAIFPENRARSSFVAQLGAWWHRCRCLCLLRTPPKNVPSFAASWFFLFSGCKSVAANAPQRESCIPPHPNVSHPFRDITTCANQCCLCEEIFSIWRSGRFSTTPASAAILLFTAVLDLPERTSQGGNHVHFICNRFSATP